MRTTEKHYVKFFSPGTLFSETREEPIPSWDPKSAVAMAERVVERYGAKPYAFAFVTYLEADPVPDGRGGTLNVEPRCTATSPMHHLGGKVETYDDVVARNDPKEEILRSNMRFGDYPIIVINTNSYRSIQPFEEDHVVVDAKGETIERGDTPERIAYRKKMLARNGSTELPSDTKGGG